MCVFRHARLIMREICTMPVPFYTHVPITYFHLDKFFSSFLFFYFSFYPSSFPRLILLFNELNRQKMRATKRERVRERQKKKTDDILNFSSFLLCILLCVEILLLYGFDLFFFLFHSIHSISFGVFSHRLNVPFVHHQCITTNEGSKHRT